LHGELAAHYGEHIGESSYQDLEGRFVADIRLKKERGVSLESGEKTLLGKVNLAKAEDMMNAQKAPSATIVKVQAQQTNPREITSSAGHDLPEAAKELRELENKKKDTNFRQAALTAPMHLFFFTAVDRNGVKRFFDLMLGQDGFSIAESAINAARLGPCRESVYEVPGRAELHHVHRIYGLYPKTNTATARLAMDKFAKEVRLTQIDEVAETHNALQAWPTWRIIFRELGCPTNDYSFKNIVAFTQ